MRNRKETGQLKKNEYRKYFFAAVGEAIIVFACVGIGTEEYASPGGRPNGLCIEN